MPKTAVEAARGGTVFVLAPEDPRFVLVNDKASPLFDERLELPVSEELALSIAREGQIDAGKVRKNGPKLEILDGRQRFRAALLVNEWLRSRDPRVAFRNGQRVTFRFEVVKPEDDKDALRKILAANLRVEDTPLVRARRISRAIKWGLTLEEARIACGFKSASTVTNILSLLDCAPDVQQAVERRELPETVARQFVPLEHDKQTALLDEMRRKGLMHGASASGAVAARKNGKAIADKSGAKRMLRREFIEKFAASLDGTSAPSANIVKKILRFVLGDPGALIGADMAPYREAINRARRS